MDPDALQDEVDEWVREGIITDEQAEEILARYEGADRRWPRIVLALSLVGAVLVFAGIALFLATNWRDLSRPARAVVLVAAPTLAYVGGVAGYDRNAPRIGHAMCILGAVLVGPSVFLFDSLYALDLAMEWLLFAWLAVMLPTGHALGSRVGTAFGLVLAAVLVAVLEESAAVTVAIGGLGIALFALGHFRDDAVAWTYRIGGTTMALAGLLGMTLLEGQFQWFDPDPTAVLAATSLGAVAGAAWLFVTEKRMGAEWSTVAVLALAGAFILGLFAPDIVPELLAFAGVHLTALVGLLATGYFGYRTESRRFIDLAAGGGMLQTLSFVQATVIDALSGSIALIVAGLILLGAGIALERGRRALLSNL
ncbi:MAG: putative membrane protein [Natronomonas sp.]|jgi:uncharacterized membrane protein